MMNTDMDIFAGAKARLLASCEYFTTYHVAIDGKAHLFCGDDSFQSFTVLSGKLMLEAGDDEVTYQKGETAFLPAGLGKYTLKGTGDFVLSKL